jgi:hypothetical protein
MGGIMNDLLKEILEGVLEIQQQHMSREQHDLDNAQHAVRIYKAAVEQRQEKIAALKEALNVPPVGV